MAADPRNSEAPEFLLQLLQSAAAHHSGGDLERAEEGYLRLLDHGYRKATFFCCLAGSSQAATWKRRSVIWTKCFTPGIWMP